jgi:hypothetical protein
MQGGSPVVGLISGELAHASPFSTPAYAPPFSAGWGGKASRTQKAHHVFDFQSVENKLGFAQLATLLEVAAQQNSSVH